MDYKAENIEEIVKKVLAGMIEELGISCYRQDFNISPLAFWRFNDETGRRGITEIKYITNMYRLWDRLRERFPSLVPKRYGIIIEENDTPHILLEKIGKARGFVSKGGSIDLGRTAKIILDEFRGGKLGKITLEMPEDIERMAANTAKAAQEKKVATGERKKKYKQKN